MHEEKQESIHCYQIGDAREGDSPISHPLVTDIEERKRMEEFDEKFLRRMLVVNDSEERDINE